MAKKKEATREQLEALAKEMNEVLGLEPAIKVTRKMTDEALIKAINENAVDEDGEPQIFESDFIESDDPEKAIFTEEASATIDLLDIAVGDDLPPEEEPEEEEKPAKGKKAAPAKEKPAPAKGKGKKAEAEEEPEEEPEEKPTKKAAPAKGKKEEPAKKAAPAKKAPAKKEASEPAYTRREAFADAVRDGKARTVSEINELANKNYVKHGGKDNVTQQDRITTRCIATLIPLDCGEVTGGKFKFTVK